MIGLRDFLFRRRMIAAGIIALAMLLKMLVPTGFMIGNERGALAIELCSGHSQMPVAMPGMAHHQPTPDHQGKDMPCAFSGLAAPSLAAADPVSIVPAIAIIIATVFRVEIAALARTPAYLRPPLRGPPARA